MTERESSIFNGDYLLAGLVWAVLIGIVSAVIGAFTVGNSLAGTVFTARETLDTLQYYSGSALLLVVGKIVLDCSFCLIALLMLYLKDRDYPMQIFSIAAGFLQMVVIILFLSVNWESGWSRILDPSEEYAAPLLQVVLSFLQSFSFILGGVRR